MYIVSFFALFKIVFVFSFPCKYLHNIFNPLKYIWAQLGMYICVNVSTDTCVLKLESILM